MAFTTSHPAAVIAINYLPKRWFSLTGLVIGSVMPDFEYFIKMRVQSEYSHTFWGMFWFDLPLSILFMLLYNAIIKDQLIDHLPTFLNERFSTYRNNGKPYFKRSLIIVIISILIGIASHLLWDSFTHPGRYFVRHMSFLTNDITLAGHHLKAYNLVQHISTIIGAIIIIYAVVQLPKDKFTKLSSTGSYWSKITGVAFLCLIMRLMLGLSIQRLGDIIATTFSGLLIGLIIASVTTQSKPATA